MKTLVLVALLLVGAVSTAAPPDPRLDWWREARFGMFIHWGLYAVPAGEWNGRTDHAEWIRTSAQIPLDQYDRLRADFAAPDFDADAWARLARRAGMQYLVITTKHHDGFCLFDTQQTDFDVMATPLHRDVMRAVADACRREGIRIGWYHSIMDWHHPDYLPRRDWEQDRPDRRRRLRPLRRLPQGPAARAAHQLRPDRRPLVRRRVGGHLEQRSAAATSTTTCAPCSPASSSTTASAGTSATTARPSSRSRRRRCPATGRPA